MYQLEERFWSAYRALVGRILRPLGKSSGFSEKSVAEAEWRLALSLPSLLREFYLIAGKRKDINGVHNRLLNPEDLYTDDNVLVFYEENQAACVWGIDVRSFNDEDPAVLREDGVSGSKWEPDFDTLPDFFIAMLLIQAVNGGMRHSGIGRALDMDPSHLGSEWDVLKLGGRWNNTVFVRDGQVLYIFGTEPAPEVFGGAQTKRKFLALEKAFAVSWDYCTLDDD